jgi:hypothetical protein
MDTSGVADDNVPDRDVLLLKKGTELPCVNILPVDFVAGRPRRASKHHQHNERKKYNFFH